MSSIRKRFLFSAAANVVRAAISLVVGLLVARGLGPEDYGNLAYLLGSFWAIRALLDMGSSSAFYTFIAQRNRASAYYIVYFLWLAFQLLFSVVLVALLLPQSVLERFWLGQDRDLILLALLATFLQNQVWQTVVQMHEAERKTVRIQFAGVILVLLHLVLVGSMMAGKWLSIRSVLLAIVAEYTIVAAWLSVILRKAKVGGDGNNSHIKLPSEELRTVIKAYFHYCRPMFVVAVFSFFYEIADRWLLQRYGGASQQGFYQVAAQLSTVSLLAASSILNIFWKEIAEANDHGLHERVAGLYLKTTQSLVFLASVVSCFLVPWAEVLINVLLGGAYHAAWPIFCMMLFYPIHQAVGQINATLFMATGRNTAYMAISVTGLLVSIPVSYVLIVPESESGGIGFGLGALGLALKIFGLNFLFVNFQSWLISRYYKITFQWRNQIAVILTLLALGYACRSVVDWLIWLIFPLTDTLERIVIYLAMVSAGLLYIFCVFIVLIKIPKLAGTERAEVMGVFRRVVVWHPWAGTR